MPSLRHDQIADVLQHTLPLYKRGKWADISLDLQKYYFARLFKGEAMKKRPERGGTNLDFRLRVRNQGSYKRTGLYAIDELNKINVLTNGSVDWAYQTANYIIDTRESTWQSGPEKYLDVTKLNEQGLDNDFFEGMETDLWTAPSSSSMDPMSLAGIPFWLQSSSTAAFGFNGGDPTGFTDGAGNIATGTYANWKNGTFTWAVISPEDFVEKTVEAMDKCHFEAPAPFPNLVPNEKPNWGLYTVYHVIKTCRRILQASNNGLGDDVAKYMGNVVVKGTPLEWVPALDNSDSGAYDSTNPFYGVNWETFEYFFKSGEAMARQPLKQSAHSHRVLERHLDNSGNCVCVDRRRNFRAYSSAPG